MSLINVSGLSKAYGTNRLFENVCFEIGEGDKVGLVGINGCGKTTLLKILSRQLPSDTGEITINKLATIGYMEQQLFTSPDATLYDEALSIFKPLMELETEIEAVNRLIENGNDSLISLQHKLNERYLSEDGLTYKSRTRAILLGFGFTTDEFKTPVSVLSGGQKAKLQLGKLLLSAPNLLLLDEPTNHLDIVSVEWLEEFLRSYPGAIITVSHDRYFLDSVTKKTFEMENGKLTCYQGGYSDYIRTKKENQLQAERHYQNVRKEMKRIEGIIEQQKRWNREKNIRTAESKQKQLDRLEATLEIPGKEPEKLRFQFRSSASGGNDVLIAEGLTKGFDQRLLFQNTDLHIRKGEHVFLLGANSSGKTTLLKILLGQQSADAGTFRLGANIRTGYYDQTQNDLKAESTILDELVNARPDLSLTELRSMLGVFLFRGDDVFKPISALSGGEKARVSLLKLMLSDANFLLMDEPTNHLDISSREAVEEALMEFDGTLLIVSHDRYFINKLANRLLVIVESKLESHIGSYDDYIQSIRNKEKQPIPVNISKNANEYFQKKAAERALRLMEGKINRTEKEIEKIENTISKLEEKLLEPSVASDYAKVLEITNEMDRLKSELDGFYRQWESFQSERDASK